MAKSEDAGLTLVSRIYEAALEPALWDEVLAQVEGELDAESSILYVADLDVREASFEVSRGLDPAVMQTYYEHYHRIDPNHACRLRQPEGSVIASHRVVTDGELEGTEYFHGFLRRLGRFYTTSGVIAQDARTQAVFSAQRTRRRGPFTEAELERLRAVFPHLRRAFHIGRELAGRELERQTMLALLERLPTGVLLLDERGRVAFVNRRAQSILAAGDGLTMTPGGLSAVAPELQPALANLIEEAAGTGAGRGRHPGGALLVPALGGSEPYQVLVTPLRTERVRLDVGRERICAAVFVKLRDAQPALEPEVLRDLFGLTPAETRVTVALVQGRRPEEIAAESETSRYTVRAQLSAIYEKLGVHRQAELVQRVLSSPAALGASESGGGEDPEPR